MLAIHRRVLADQNNFAVRNTLRIAGLILTAGLALVVLALRRRREQVA